MRGGANGVMYVVISRWNRKWLGRGGIGDAKNKRDCATRVGLPTFKPKNANGGRSVHRAWIMIVTMTLEMLPARELPASV